MVKISRVKIPVRKESKRTRELEMILGRNKQLSQSELAGELLDLREDGFMTKTTGKKLIITGGAGKGTLYGVYTFLEKYLGCRMYSSSVLTIPDCKITLGSPARY